MTARLDHVSLVAADVAVTTGFYDAVLGAAGIGRVVAHQDVEDADEVGAEAVGYGRDDAQLLWVVAGRGATTHAHVAIRVDDTATVDRAAVAGGGTPRRRELDRPGYYGVLLADPDGNTVELFRADR